MKLVDLQKPISEMSTEELLEKLRQVRHNRFVERPAAKKREAAAEQAEERKTTKKSNTKLDKMLQGMSQAELEALLKKLQGSESDTTNQPADDSAGQAGGRGEV